MKKCQVTGKTQTIEGKTYYQFTIELHSKRRIYELWCETHRDATQWVKVIELLGAQAHEQQPQQIVVSSRKSVKISTDRKSVTVTTSDRKSLKV